ncbi:MAG TPA: hypothetical protein VKT82_26260 [Ktedonobacterales bacterium]|nr:hypothetical protein [Ktedonobacterales bacterium]
MLKQHLLKLVLGLSIIATLLGGVGAEASSMAAAKVAPAHNWLACVGGAGTPCGG